MLWTYQELKRLRKVVLLFLKNKVPIGMLKEELRWLDKKLQDRVEEVCSGLLEGTEYIPPKELVELLEGEEEEVVIIVKERLERQGRKKNGAKNT